MKEEKNEDREMPRYKNKEVKYIFHLVSFLK